MPRTLFKEKHPLDPNAGLLGIALKQFNAASIAQENHLLSGTGINSHQLVIVDVPGWRAGEMISSTCIFDSNSNDAFGEFQSRRASCGVLFLFAMASKMLSESVLARGVLIY